MRKRVFDREFKLEICRKVENGELGPAQVCREHQLAHSLLDRWRDQYRRLGEEAFQGQHTPTPDTDAVRISALEVALGKLHLENQLLKEALQKKGCGPGRRWI